MSNLPKPKTAIYRTTLPSNKQVVQFRPWTIAEEKTLLIAKDDNDPDTARTTLFNVLDACVGDIDAKELPDLDIDWLLFQLSAKSDGEISTLLSNCGSCSHKMEFHCDKIKDVTVTGDLESLKNDRVQVDDDIWFALRLPTKKDIDDLVNDDLSIEQIIARCLDMIYTKDEMFSAKEHTVEGLTEYIENEFEKSSLVGVYNYFKDFPKVVLSHTTKCPKCGNDNTLRIEGFDDFFL